MKKIYLAGQDVFRANAQVISESIIARGSKICSSFRECVEDLAKSIM